MGPQHASNGIICCSASVSQLLHKRKAGHGKGGNSFWSQKKFDLLESKGLSSCLIALECQQETLFLAFDQFKLVSCLHGEKARSVAKEESREEMNV